MQQELNSYSSNKSMYVFRLLKVLQLSLNDQQKQITGTIT